MSSKTPLLRIHFRNNAELRELLVTSADSATLFCPTTTEFSAGSSILVELSAPALPNRVYLRGRVREWRTALPRKRIRAGCNVALEEPVKWQFIQNILDGKLTNVRKRKHRRLPVQLPVSYRGDVGDSIESFIEEISVGGALLLTPNPIPFDQTLVLTLTLPGSEQRFEVEARPSYHAKSDTGLRFIAKNATGKTRLKELVRRLEESIHERTVGTENLSYFS